MDECCPSLHVLGSNQFGGADQFYMRLVHALQQARQPVAAITRQGSPVAQALAGQAVEHLALPFLNTWDVWTALKVRTLVARRQPCVVQTYMGRATRLTRLPKNSGAVHVARLGGYYKLDGYYRHAHAWVGNTRGVCDYLVKSGLPAGRVFQIGNFVPEPGVVASEALAQLRAAWTIPEDAWVVFTLGRLIEVKGFDDLLRALAQLPPRVAGRPVVALIAGDGLLAEPLKALAEDLGLGSRLRWLGWQAEPAAFYRLADAFVCPSRHETLGNVILEAWSYGLPVVSTATPGALELVEDGCTGVLCPCAEPSALAGCLAALLSGAAQDRWALGTAGRARLEQAFSKDAIVGAYVALYRDLLRR